LVGVRNLALFVKFETSFGKVNFSTIFTFEAILALTNCRCIIKSLQISCDQNRPYYFSLTSFVLIVKKFSQIKKKKNFLKNKITIGKLLSFEIFIFDALPLITCLFD
jgi:hypothetical protein